MASYTGFFPNQVSYTREQIDAVITAEPAPRTYYEILSIRIYNDSPLIISGIESICETNDFDTLCRELQAYILTLITSKDVDSAFIDIYRRVPNDDIAPAKLKRLQAKTKPQDENRFHACIPVYVKNRAFCSIYNTDPFYEAIMRRMPTIRNHIAYIINIQTMDKRDRNAEYVRVFHHSPTFWLKRRARTITQLANHAREKLLQ